MHRTSFPIILPPSEQWASGGMKKLIKSTCKKCFDSSGDPQIALLQICVTPLGQRLPSLATMLFNCLIIGILPVINGPPVGIDNDQEHYVGIVKRQTKDDKGRDTPKIYVSILIGSTVVVQ